jgi:molybdopterin-biosynthesis enzyme MoeA-like protein
MEGIARSFGQKIQRNAELEAAIRGYYAAELIEPNLRMADVPEGVKLIGGRALVPRHRCRECLYFSRRPRNL